MDINNIAVVGTFQVGKSTIVNCLTDPSLANVGVGLSTTHTVNFYKRDPCSCAEAVFRDINATPLLNASGNEMVNVSPPIGTARIDIKYPGHDRKIGTIIDTPGFDASGRDASNDTHLTSKIISSSLSDLILLVVPNSQLDLSLRRCVIPHIIASKKNVVALMNCNRGDPNPMADQNVDVASQIELELKTEGVSLLRVSQFNGQFVLPCNAAWGWVAQSELTATPTFNTEMQAILKSRAQNVVNYFEIIRGARRPSARQLWHLSNLSQLEVYLADASIRKSMWDSDNPKMADWQITSELQRKLNSLTFKRF